MSVLVEVKSLLGSPDGDSIARGIDLAVEYYNRLNVKPVLSSVLVGKLIVYYLNFPSQVRFKIQSEYTNPKAFYKGLMRHNLSAEHLHKEEIEALYNVYSGKIEHYVNPQKELEL